MKIKEEIKKTGDFWLPIYCEKVPGILSISNETGIELEATRSFEDDVTTIDNLFNSHPDSKNVVVGHIQEYGFIILEGCLSKTDSLNVNIASATRTSHVISANRAFTGFPDIQRGVPSFNTFKFSIEGIDEWVWIHGINPDYNPEERTKTISIRPPENISFNLNNEMRLEITFDIASTISQSPLEIGVTQKAYFKLVSEDAQELKQFISVAQKIVDLLCFTINKTVYFDSMSATSNAICQEHGEGITYPAPITIYDPSVFYDSKDQPRIDRNRMLFTFSDIRDNAEGIINKWIESYEDYQNALDLYFLAQLKPQLSWAVKFITLAQGLEVFHRRMSSDDAPDMGEVKLKYKEVVQSLIRQYPDGENKKWLEGKLEHLNDVSLGKRIKELINPFKAILGNSQERGKLAYKIAVTRNYLTHYNPDLEPKAATGGDLHLLCLKMELLFELHFLNLIGFTPQKIQSIVDNCPKLQWKRSLSLSGDQ